VKKKRKKENKLYDTIILMQASDPLAEEAVSGNRV
jgi:hypothetical protein